MKKVVFLFLIIFGCFLPAQEEQKYILPLPYFTGVSSSFMEFRTNHFHTGIDLRTEQKTGMPVLAVSDGWIVKLRMVTVDTGRMVFLKHRDGKLSIYYHLDRFNSQLEQMVKQVQKQTGKKYFGYFQIEPPIAVKQGALIAYSGESGVGFPHLHFELHDAQDGYLNPFLWIQIPKLDIYPPTGRSIVLRTREETLINGDSGEFYFPLSKKNQTYSLHSPFVADGPFDLIFQASDLTDCRKVSSPYSIEAYIDQLPFYYFQADRFFWEDHNQVGFLYDLTYSAMGVFYYNLFSQPRFNLERSKASFYEMVKKLSPGLHQIRIQIRDHVGNQADLQIPFEKTARADLGLSAFEVKDNSLQLHLNCRAGNPADFFSIRIYNAQQQVIAATGEIPLPTGPKRIDIPLSKNNPPYSGEFQFFHQRELSFRKPFLLMSKTTPLPQVIPMELWINRNEIFLKCAGLKTSTDQIRLKVIQGSEEKIFFPIETKTGIFFYFQPLNQEPEMDLRLVFSQNQIPVREIQKRLQLIVLKNGVSRKFEKGGVRLEFADKCVNEPKTLLFENEVEVRGDQGFPMLAKPCSLSPLNVPFLDKVDLTFHLTVLPGNPKQIGIFKYNPRTRFWRYVNTEIKDSGKTLVTQLRSPGVFALFRDTEYPYIKLLSSRRQSVYLPKPLYIRVRDRGKGIDEESIRIRVNGEEPDWELDLDRALIKVSCTSQFRRGKNLLEIEASDRGGNLSRQEYSISAN